MRKNIIKVLIFIIVSACALCLASCDKVFSVGIDTHTHEYTPWSENTATCTEQGQQTKTCKICNDVQVRVTEALGHDIVEYRDCEPTCTEYGSDGYSACVRCDYSVGGRIDPTGHDMPDWTTTLEPTCTEAGARARRCNVCHEPENEEIKANGHKMSAWTLETEATCEEPGVKTRACDTCQMPESREIEPLGHNMQAFEDSVVNCTDYGYSNYAECSRCDHFEGEKTDPLGHKLSNWINNTATCTEGGKESAVCENGCGKTEYRDTVRLGHSIDANGKCTVCHKKNILILIEEGKAKFNVVVTAKAGAEGMLVAFEFVSRLRGLGVEVNDVIRETTSSPNMTECEIIIGAGALNRGDECCITETELGADGTIIRMVGSRIIIAGATPTLTAREFALFLSDHLGLTASTQSLDYLEADSRCCHENSVDYVIDSITIGGVDLKEYGYVLDVAGASSYSLEDIDSFHDELFELSGYWMVNSRIFS